MDRVVSKKIYIILVLILYGYIMVGCIKSNTDPVNSPTLVQPTEVKPSETVIVTKVSTQRVATRTPTLPPLPTKTIQLNPTITLVFTSTPIPPTSIPTIPTFTPTLNIKSIVTATPAPSAKCPQEKASVAFEIPFCGDLGCSSGPYRNEIKKYLDSGGALHQLLNKMGDSVTVVDLTGDGIKELVFRDDDDVVVLGCNNEQYDFLLEDPGIHIAPNILKIEDVNGDGISELILSYLDRGCYEGLRIFGWNGDKLASLLKIEDVWGNKIYTIDIFHGIGSHFTIVNTNHPGLKDIHIEEDESCNLDNLLSSVPWRKAYLTLKWNGVNFVITDKRMAEPEYQFQAIQDADQMVLQGQYQAAIKLYKEAISNRNLGWWTEERSFYLLLLASSGFSHDSATPDPSDFKLTPNPAEYPSLAAYAYYRLMILDVFLGKAEQVGDLMAFLQKKFPVDTDGRDYIEMAADFWDEYQRSKDISAACANAIDYANKHLDILVLLGSEYHGWQSHAYTPNDVCPFR